MHRPGQLVGKNPVDLALPFDGETIADLLGDNRYKSDAIHPNAAGYARLAEAVQTLLKDAGAL